MRKSTVASIVVILVLLTGILLSVAGYLVIRRIFLSDTMRNTMLARVEESIGRKVSVGRVTPVIFPQPGVSIRKLCVSNSPDSGFSGDPFVQCDNCTFSISLLSLLTRKPLLQKIFMENVRFLVEIDSSGKSNYDDLSEKSEGNGTPAASLPPLPLPPSLKLLIIKHGKVTIRELHDGKEYSFDDITLRSFFSISATLEEALSHGTGTVKNVSSVRMSGRDTVFHDGPFSLRYSIRGAPLNGYYAIDELNITGNHNTAVAVTGSISQKNTAHACSLKCTASLCVSKNESPIQFPGHVKIINGKIDAGITFLAEFDSNGLRDIVPEGTIELTEVTILPGSEFPHTITGSGSVVVAPLSVEAKFSIISDTSDLLTTVTLENYRTFFTTEVSKKRPFISFEITSEHFGISRRTDDTVTGGRNAVGTAEQTQTEKSIIPPLIIPGIDCNGEITVTSFIYKGLPFDSCRVTVCNSNDTGTLYVSAQSFDGVLSDSLHLIFSDTSHCSFSNEFTMHHVETEKIIPFLFKGIPAERNKKKTLGLRGRADIQGNVTGEITKGQLKQKSLYGDVSVAIKKGSIDNSLILRQLSGAVEKFIDFDVVDFNDLSSHCSIGNEKVIINDFALFSTAGDWTAKGTVGFNSLIDVQVRNRLSEVLSEQVIRIESGGKSIIKGLLKGTRFEKTAASIINTVRIPVDEKGRVTLKLSLTGTTADPHAMFSGFGR